MDPTRRRELRECYEQGLLGDTIPFWIRHAIDNEDGGYLFCLDQDGSIVDTDKGMWQHGRFAWMLSTLYTTIDAQQKWLDLAAHGIAFMERHAFDTDGKMFFHLAKDGSQYGNGATTSPKLSQPSLSQPMGMRPKTLPASPAEKSCSIRWYTASQHQELSNQSLSLAVGRVNLLQCR